MYVQWVLSPFPQNSTYQIWFRYSNPTNKRVRGVLIIQEDMYDARVIFNICTPPSVCYAPLVMADNITDVASFMLSSGTQATLILSLSGVELNLVSER